LSWNDDGWVDCEFVIFQKRNSQFMIFEMAAGLIFFQRMWQGVFTEAILKALLF
jgi:hypothetical protein